MVDSSGVGEIVNKGSVENVAGSLKASVEGAAVTETLTKVSSDAADAAAKYDMLRSQGSAVGETLSQVSVEAPKSKDILDQGAVLDTFNENARSVTETLQRTS